MLWVTDESVAARAEDAWHQAGDNVAVKRGVAAVPVLTGPSATP